MLLAVPRENEDSSDFCFHIGKEVLRDAMEAGQALNYLQFEPRR